MVYGAPRTRHAQKATTASTSASHSQEGPSSRATRPRSDWLDTNARLPTRSVSQSATVQNSRDAAGATAAARSVAAAAVPLATTAARYRRVTSR